MNSGFASFTKKYSRVIVAVILVLMLVLAGVLKFEQARGFDLFSDANETAAETADVTADVTGDGTTDVTAEGTVSGYSEDAETVGGSGADVDQLAGYEPETRIKIMKKNGSEATVVLFSTTELDEETYYDLYVVEKRDGEWEKSAYIRTIMMPSAVKTREGKYRYYSDAVSLERLSDKTIYQLIPHNEENNHSSVPFWTRLT